MDINNAIKIILRDIEEARAILDEVAGTSHITEIGLAKARLHSAAEMLALVPLLSDKTATVEKKESVASAAPRENKKQETFLTQKKEVKPEPSLLTEKVSKEEPVADVQEQPAQDKEETRQLNEAAAPVKETSSEINEKSKETVHSSQLIFADRFDKDNVLGEQLSVQPDNDLLKTLSAKPVEDITTAIGINDRFFFTRELFGGKQEEYYRTISRLNKATGIEEAIEILDTSVVGNPDVLAYTAFTDLLKRKFPVK